MGLFSRISNLFKASTHGVIDRMEDPEAMLNQYLRNMESQMRKAEASVVRIMGTAKQLSAQINEEQELLEKYANHAVAAAQIGNEELARHAIVKKQQHAAKLEILNNEFAATSKSADELRQALQKMHEEYVAMTQRKDALIARASSHKAQKKVMKALRDMSSSDGVAAGFNRVEQRINNMGYEAMAYNELQQRNWDDELQRISDNKAIDDELQALKIKFVSNAG
ncbi:PspA/IM30 family protein (plasmid) [Paenibacillus sp. EC2-1]|uniref:PspA/IM30 family protein n=1 Tax=Paenibacillus sp. EC2-1 TaxID=3388665 RepID=UPI003BEED0B3